MRLNQLEGSGIVEALENVIQATKLLQVNKKTLEDVEAICEVCSSLNTLQVNNDPMMNLGALTLSKAIFFASLVTERGCERAFINKSILLKKEKYLNGVA